MTSPLLVTFEAGETGPWRIERMTALAGPPLATAPFLNIGDGTRAADGLAWRLRGATGHQRYTMRAEAQTLASKQEGLGRIAATWAALIPIRKSDEWWSLAQDERRAIFEEQSRHIQIGLDYLPGVARRLHHSRELGEAFDFITWFEYAPEDEVAFDHMLARLRASAEWRYVDREIDIRLSRV